MVQQKVRFVGIVAGILSLLALCLSLTNAIFTTDFHLPKNKSAIDAVLATENICSDLDDGLKFLPSSFEGACDDFIAPSVDLLVNESMEFSLGSVADGYSWKECRAAPPDSFVSRFNGAEVPQSALERCVKLSIANIMGVRLGETRILGILLDLITSREYALFATILFFGILFPFLKALAALVSVLRWTDDSNWYLKVASVAGKWSMTDVFVVSVMIVNVKMNAIGLEIESAWGLYYLLASGVISSLGIQYINRSRSGLV